MPASERSLDLARRAARAADDKVATTIAGIDVSDRLPLTDVFVVVSADNERQIGAIVDEVEERVRGLLARLDGRAPADGDQQRP